MNEESRQICSSLIHARDEFSSLRSWIGSSEEKSWDGKECDRIDDDPRDNEPTDGVDGDENIPAASCSAHNLLSVASSFVPLPGLSRSSVSSPEREELVDHLTLQQADTDSKKHL